MNKNKAKAYFRLFLIFAVVLMLLVVGLKLKTYLFISPERLRPLIFDQKIIGFYKENLRLPKHKAEFEFYINEVGDKEYLGIINSIDYNLKYDSVSEEVYLYSNGMDWDDDGLSKSYLPKKFGFLKSMFVDGDLLIQRVKLN